MVAAVAVVAALVGGCGAGPAQAGSAVIVGNEAVPVEVVAARLDTAVAVPGLVEELAAQGKTVPDLAREIVTGIVLGELLERAAAREGVTVTDEDVEREIARSGGHETLLAGAPYDGTVLREIVRNQLTSIRLGERYAQGLAVTVDLIATESREEADAAAETLAAGGPGAEALIRSAVQNARQGAVVPVVPETAAWPVFGVPVGTTVVFEPSPGQAGWVAAKVTAIGTEEADAEAAGDLPPNALAALGRQLARPAAVEAGLRVNPRYGRWDPITLAVVPDALDNGRILPPAAP